MNWKECLEKIEPIDLSLAEKVQKRLDNLTKPRGSLGRLEEVAKRVCLIRGTLNPVLQDKVIFTLAGDHGVVEEGVSAYPQEVTPQMVYNFLRDGAGINVLAGHVGARVVVVDMGVGQKIRNPRLRRGFGGQAKSEIRNFKDKKINYGTKNMIKGPAMTRDEAIRSIETGIELMEEELGNGVDIIGTGDMGIGNTTSSSAIVAAITHEKVEKVTGRGTGINDEIFQNKIRVIKKALEVNKPNGKDAIDVLYKVGGFEIGGLTGIILAAAANKIPVVIDGFISGAGALIACQLEPKVKEYMIAAHRSVEQGHKIVLNWLGLRPLLDLNLRLGEGTGAALGIFIVEAGIKILNKMATFEDAGVAKENI